MHPIGTGYYYNLFTISNYPQKGPPKWQPNKANKHESIRGDPKEIPVRTSHARSRCQQVAWLAAPKVIVKGGEIDVGPRLHLTTFYKLWRAKSRAPESPSRVSLGDHRLPRLQSPAISLIWSLSDCLQVRWALCYQLEVIWASIMSLFRTAEPRDRSTGNLYPYRPLSTSPDLNSICNTPTWMGNKNSVLTLRHKNKNNKADLSSVRFPGILRSV